MLIIDICYFRHQVWRLIIAICVYINRWQQSVPILQNSKSSSYLDSVGILDPVNKRTRYLTCLWDWDQIGIKLGTKQVINQNLANLIKKTDANVYRLEKFIFGI